MLSKRIYVRGIEGALITKDINASTLPAPKKKVRPKHLDRAEKITA
jgi:hypothetical protein